MIGTKILDGRSLSGTYAVGILHNGQLHLNQLEGIVEVRPELQEEEVVVEEESADELTEAETKKPIKAVLRKQQDPQADQNQALQQRRKLQRTFVEEQWQKKEVVQLQFDESLLCKDEGTFHRQLSKQEVLQQEQTLEEKATKYTKKSRKAAAKVKK